MRVMFERSEFAIRRPGFRDRRLGLGFQDLERLHHEQGTGDTGSHHDAELNELGQLRAIARRAKQ